MPQELRVNQSIQIQKLSEQEKKPYPSYIAALDAETITLAAPLSKGRFVPFSRGEIVRVLAWPLAFTTEVLNRRFVPHPLLVVRRPQVFEPLQRRCFVRLEERLPLVVRVLTGGDGLTPKVSAEVKTETIDISGGGVLFLCDRELDLGTWLELDVFLPEKITSRGRVTRCVPVGAGSGIRIGAEFVGIGRGDQDKIIKYIFRRQLELRQKGLL